MPIDSTTAGYIAPMSKPVYDDALDDYIQAALAGITGVDPNLIRPRLQAEGTTIPGTDQTWCSMGVVGYDREWADNDSHDYTADYGQGTNTQRHSEEIEVLISCFGPFAAALEATIRAGLQVEQNRTALRNASGLEFVEHRRVIRVPALIKNIYVPRWDSTLILRRRVSFTYPIRNVLSANFQVKTDVGINTTTNVTSS